MTALAGGNRDTVKLSINARDRIQSHDLTLGAVQSPLFKSASKWSPDTYETMEERVDAFLNLLDSD